ncbi:hypothetical protein PIIN_11659 [Serendipita indica DSM 11827]|uniref:Uncharacterized protein n=1 Tax=Serendipita indica (strain DSM 11827) TaxID=1109443 RepID=G4U288_SERID|nr:hypothetical protein PIIN_11659 [Serendipita indica DSM 11827]
MRSQTIRVYRIRESFFLRTFVPDHSVVTARPTVRVGLGEDGEDSSYGPASTLSEFQEGKKKGRRVTHGSTGRRSPVISSLNTPAGPAPTVDVRAALGHVSRLVALPKFTPFSPHQSSYGLGMSRRLAGSSWVDGVEDEQRLDGGLDCRCTRSASLNNARTASMTTSTRRGVGRGATDGPQTRGDGGDDDSPAKRLE